MTRKPLTSKEAAVRQWEDAVKGIPDDSEYKNFFVKMDIHDSDDRKKAEEIIRYEMSGEHRSYLEDAFYDLKSEFDW